MYLSKDHRQIENLKDLIFCMDIDLTQTPKQTNMYCMTHQKVYKIYWMEWSSNNL